MNFDGTMMHEAIKDLQKSLEGARLQKLYQRDNHDFLWQFHRGQKMWVLLSVHPSSARIHRTNLTFDKPSEPPLFTRVLRKHLEQARLLSLKQHGNDRVVTMTFSVVDELKDRHIKHLHIELFGKDSNLILTNEQDTIIDALYTNSPLDDTPRVIMVGAVYDPPQDTRINPYDDVALTSLLEDPPKVEAKAYIKELSGVSPQLMRRVIEAAQTQGRHPIAHLQRVLSEPTFVRIEGEKKDEYALTHTRYETDRVNVFENVVAWADDLTQTLLKAHASGPLRKSLYQWLTRQQKRLEEKTIKLTQSFKDAEDTQDERTKGNLLMGVHDKHQKGLREITLNDYTTQAPMTIALDETKTLLENAQQYFKRAKKKQTSLPYLKRELSKANTELAYLALLYTQWRDADERTLEELRDELRSLGYLAASKKKGMPQKPSKPRQFIDADGVTHLVGKNNRQNAYLTHSLGKPNEWWFHTQAMAGAHVLVRSEADQLSETTLRTAAQLASYYSAGKDASSVPIDYTRIKYIKKIPGKHGCFVRYTHQHTIYIDPDESFILKLKTN